METNVRTLYVSYRADEYEVEVYEVTDGTFVLAWGDYVANEWEETYVSLSLALARMAVLARCAHDFTRMGFRQADSVDFVQHAERFFADTVAVSL